MRNRILPVFALALVILTPELNAADGEPGVEPPPHENLSEGWYAQIDTSQGNIVVRLLPDQAPQAVAQFAALAEGKLDRTDPATGEASKARFYDGASVYLADAGLRFEAGDPTGAAYGGPSLWVSPREGGGPVNFDAAGRLGLNLTSGRGATPYSFIVTASPQPRLSGRYPCFGIVVKGLDVVLSISEVKTLPNGRPIEPVTIERVGIFSVGEPPPLQEPDSYQSRPKRLAPRPRPRQN
jgi:peptidyl-prolyl cis-trans isomerase A (cyclophilin A)